MSKNRIGILRGKPIVEGDKNIVTSNEIHISDFNEGSVMYAKVPHDMMGIYNRFAFSIYCQYILGLRVQALGWVVEGNTSVLALIASEGDINWGGDEAVGSPRIYEYIDDEGYYYYKMFKPNLIKPLYLSNSLPPEEKEAFNNAISKLYPKTLTEYIEMFKESEQDEAYKHRNRIINITKEEYEKEFQKLTVENYKKQHPNAEIV